MPSRKRNAHLYDPRAGGEAVRVEPLKLGRKVWTPPRTNYFSIVWIQKGNGVFWADTLRYIFEASSLLFFVPYQQIRLEPTKAVQGEVIRFHANFLCVETFHAEVGCAGTLFNDPYGTPAVPLDDAMQAEMQRLVKHLHSEQAERDLAFREVMLAHMKVLLVLATRLKASPAKGCAPSPHATRHPVLIELKELIEQHYHTLHAPADYAKLLHITPKTLGRIVREQLGTTPTELIRNRILTHAKWQILHTLRPVKEIARELGYDDELYFSRLFKKATGYSPTFFREFETEIRGGSNLSMDSAQASIPMSPSQG